MTKEKIPKIDLEELKKFKEQNFKERLEFIDLYTEWLKKKKIKNGANSKNNLLILKSNK